LINILGLNIKVIDNALQLFGHMAPRILGVDTAYQRKSDICVPSIVAEKVIQHRNFVHIPRSGFSIACDSVHLSRPF
jgi:hypothetical protein